MIVRTVHIQLRTLYILLLIKGIQLSENKRKINILAQFKICLNYQLLRATKLSYSAFHSPDPRTSLGTQYPCLLCPRNQTSPMKTWSFRCLSSNPICIMKCFYSWGKKILKKGLEYIQCSAINVRIKYYFQSTVKIEDSDGSCSERIKFIVLFYSWKRKLKLSCCEKKWISCTNVHVDTSHIEVEVLDKYENQTLQALGIHHMGCNAVSNLQHPIHGRWEATGQSRDHIIWTLENLPSWKSLVSLLFRRNKLEESHGNRWLWDCSEEDRSKLCSMFIVGRTSNNLKLQNDIQVMENILTKETRCFNSQPSSTFLLVE